MKKLVAILILLLTAKIVSAQSQYESIQDYGDSWKIVKLGKKYGLLDEKGKEIVKPIYDKIYDFGTLTDGWALVIREGKYGAINSKGEEILQAKYDEIKDFDTKLQGFAEVRVGNKYAFIDKKGKEVTSN